MQLFISAENGDLENRVSITPDAVKELANMGHKVLLENMAGEKAGFSNEDYERAGALVVSQDEIKNADVVFTINSISQEKLSKLKKSAIVIGALDPFWNCDALKNLQNLELTSFTLDLIPRTTRAQYMDVLSSQASLAGYKAVIEASHLLNRAIPLMMTTAGTIQAAKVLVIGAGVAGLQAIATAKRLGAIVSAFDVRTSAKEQVESLGAKFVEVDSDEKTDGVYAKEMSLDYQKAQEQKLREVLPQQDIVITTAQIPGKKAPVIIKNDMVETMKRNSIIIDLAAKTGGNCELTVIDQTIERDGVKIIGFGNILNLIPFDASKLFSKNMLAFFKLLVQAISEKNDIMSIDDEIISSTLLTHQGNIINERIKNL